ncbi:hypothetical protein TCEL_02346 [Thermobrachium celere DSM 8682]|uniref:Uncharacterized protein n=1 Tax=Thermobrachium celere DSM 8682 TaxID=941824 RepID=R7RTA4_9CLOT|nr:hypothetical protein TCEL_02346 [Thermobrachium celere DSM 8682]
MEVKRALFRALIYKKGVEYGKDKGKITFKWMGVNKLCYGGINFTAYYRNNFKLIKTCK